jgi:hypothetical protein
MDLQEIYKDITETFDKENVDNKEINLYYFKKYPHTEHPGKNPNKLISDTYKIEVDSDNFIEIDYECRDGNRTFEIRPDSNSVTVSLIIDKKAASSKSYHWLDR